MGTISHNGDISDLRASPVGFLFPVLQSLPLDALSSKQFVTIMDVLSEGEIEGFPSAAGYTQGTNTYNIAALKDVYLGKTPILKASADPANTQDDDFNFKNIKFNPRFGTSDQTFINGINSVETEQAVNVKVVQATPVVRQITNTNIDAVRVTVRFTALTKVTQEGDTIGRTVNLQVQLIQNDGTTTTPITDSVHGRSFNAYSRDYRINIPSGASFPIQIKVIRTSPDTTVSTARDDFFWTSFTEIIDEQNAYPDIAHVGLRFDSEQFPSIPPRMFKVRGVKIKIPHNASVDQTTGRLIYTGTFNGTLTTATHWTSDPSWILFNLLTNTRFGLGDHITEDKLDKFAFYSASVYCSELVDDGQGGTEPRFSLNTVLQKREDAYTTINALTSVMRSMTFWSAGSLTLTQDRPTDPSYLFNLSNVSIEGFSYQGTALKARSTSVSVSYFDMENQVLDFETVNDDAAIAKYGTIQKKVTGFGCSSRNQARRLGRFMLFEEQNSTETISFVTGLSEGAIVRPAQVIEVSDSLRAGLRRGGRINAATTTTVTVDDTENTDLDATNNPTLSVVMPDGTVETKDVSGISGAVITVSSAFSTTPNVNSVWVLQNNTLQTTTWKVVSVSESEGQYAIVGTAYNSGKFAFIEDGTALPTRNVSVLNEILVAPTNLTAQETFYVEDNKAKTKILVTFQSVSRATGYQVDYRKDGENYTTVNIRSNDFTIFDTDAGTYDIRVSTRNAALEVSTEPSTIQFQASGKTAVPANVQNLRIEPISDKLIRLRWDASVDQDVLHGGFCKIRHSSKTDGSGVFDKAVDIDKLAGNSTDIIVPYIEGEYLVRFVDDGGRMSAGSASIVIDLPDTQGSLLTQTRREDNDSPKFQGTKTNVAFDAVTNSLNLVGGGNFDTIADFDAVTSLDDFGGIVSEGTYDFANTLDLGAVFSLDLKHHFLTEGFYPSDLFDSRSALINTWTDFDGSVANDVNAELLVRTTQTDPSGSPTYTAFQTFVNGTYKGRGFQFRTKLTSNDVAQDIKVSQLGYTATLQRRTEQSNTAISSGAGIKNITFDKTFFTGTAAINGANSSLPSIGITAQNMASGDYFEVTNVSGTGFSVHFKNSSNASISRNFNYSVVGFGKGA